jgi:hypothetical protein
MWRGEIAMSIFNVKSLQLLISWIVLMAPPVWSQTATLKGKVLDATSKLGIKGVDVTIGGSDGKRLNYISDDDGIYSVGNLKRGQTICVSYSRNGYRPNPRTEPVRLDAAQNMKDVQLYQDTIQSAYWIKWSNGVKSSVETSTKQPAEQTRLYDEAWYSIAHIGLSPEAQAKAAYHLVDAAPQASRSPTLENVSKVDRDDLTKATTGMRAAVTGQAKLSKQVFMFDHQGKAFFLPAETAAEIAADELSKQPEGEISREDFAASFQTVWGVKGSQELKIALSRYDLKSCQTSVGETTIPTRH